MASTISPWDNFGKWLEENGVTYTGMDEFPVAVPFKATIDLNVLKAAVASLVQEADIKARKETREYVIAFLNGEFEGY